MESETTKPAAYTAKNLHFIRVNLIDTGSFPLRRRDDTATEIRRPNTAVDLYPSPGPPSSRESTVVPNTRAIAAIWKTPGSVTTHCSILRTVPTEISAPRATASCENFALRRASRTAEARRAASSLCRPEILPMPENYHYFSTNVIVIVMEDV